MKKPVILVTCFEPFLDYKVNASQEAANLLPDEVGGCVIKKRVLPVRWFECVTELEKAIEETRPNVILSTGQGYPKPPLLIERLGVNMACGIDNSNCVDLREEPIFPNGPVAYFSTFPYEAMHKRLKAEGVPVLYSFSAGQNQCNCVLYSALHFAATRYPGIKAGFIHVPMVADSSQEGMFTSEDTARALNFCLEEIAATLTRPVRSLDEYRDSL